MYAYTCKIITNNLLYQVCKWTILMFLVDTTHTYVSLYSGTSRVEVL